MVWVTYEDVKALLQTAMSIDKNSLPVVCWYIKACFIIVRNCNHLLDVEWKQNQNVSKISFIRSFFHSCHVLPRRGGIGSAFTHLRFDPEMSSWVAGTKADLVSTRTRQQPTDAPRLPGVWKRLHVGQPHLQSDPDLFWFLEQLPEHHRIVEMWLQWKRIRRQWLQNALWSSHLLQSRRSKFLIQWFNKKILITYAYDQI